MRSPIPLSAAQSAFLAAADNRGATSPAHARPLADWPRLSGRELDALIDRGLVREAGERTYYAYAPRRDHVDISRADDFDQTGVPRWARRVKTIAFWLVLILIPIVLLLLTRTR